MLSVTDEVESLITQLGDHWAENWNAGNLEKVVDHYADDAVYQPPHHATLHGRYEIHEYLKGPMKKRSIRDLQYLVTFVKHSGDLAYDVGVYSMTIPTVDGHDRRDRGKYLTVWRRQPDGEWKIVADCWSSDLPPMI
ncbi:MAG TPA: SgcJ/EcaC family oxidoreductase [Terriglobales bacterium]|nr:SgcJ/EcaC family oxidoreductase [Terriglobales bacterium]